MFFETHTYHDRFPPNDQEQIRKKSKEQKEKGQGEWGQETGDPVWGNPPGRVPDPAIQRY